MPGGKEVGRRGGWEKEFNASPTTMLGEEEALLSEVAGESCS